MKRKRSRVREGMLTRSRSFDFKLVFTLCFTTTISIGGDDEETGLFLNIQQGLKSKYKTKPLTYVFHWSKTSWEMKSSFFCRLAKNGSSSVWPHMFHITCRLNGENYREGRTFSYTARWALRCKMLVGNDITKWNLVWSCLAWLFGRELITSSFHRCGAQFLKARSLL